MTSFNNHLDQCLDVLYDYSGNFKISIELIQKLAQQLKLETFIDKHAYTVNPDPKFQQLKSQRLSIAGSLILVDIDFTDDKSIINVSLSSGNQINQNIDNKNETPGDCYKIETNEENIKVIKIDTTKKSLTFFEKIVGADSNVAETILLKNLSNGENLDKFPSNLKYLATLDRFSSSDNDLFLYMENITLMLNTIYQTEIQSQSDWLHIEGFANSVGKISLNNQNTLELGLFIDFWRDFRYLNHQHMKENSSTNLLSGRTHRILVSIDSIKGNDSGKGFLSKSQESSFKLIKNTQLLESHKVEMINMESVDSDSSESQCSINLIFSDPIYMPIEVLEYTGLKYKIHSSYISNPNRFDDWEGRVYRTKDSNISVQVSKQIAARLIPIDSVQVNELHDLLMLLPILRNFLVLDNIIQTLSQNLSNENIEGMDDSKPDGYENKLTEEVKKRLRESLKLSNDVTDDELLSLNAITNNNEVTLDSILRYSSEDLTNNEDENFLILSLDGIDFKSKNFDLMLSFDSNVDSRRLSLKFKISNGIVCDFNADENSMLVDSDGYVERFIKGLNLTEDVIKVLNFIYVS